MAPGEKTAELRIRREKKKNRGALEGRGETQDTGAVPKERGADEALGHDVGRVVCRRHLGKTHGAAGLGPAQHGVTGG